MTAAQSRARKAGASPQKSRLAGLTAHRHPDDPEIEAARRDLADANAALAVDDPAQLARAARIVRIALERGRLTLAPAVQDGDGDAG